MLAGFGGVLFKTPGEKINHSVFLPIFF